MKQLEAVRRAAQASEIPPSVAFLRQQLLQKYGDAVVAIIFYGSCMHDVSVGEGVVDLYLVVDDYSSVLPNRSAALAAWLLPPAVHFLQVSENDRILRAKYALFSTTDFISGTSTGWFHGYLSARMAQPVGLLYSRDAQQQTMVYECLSRAVLTLAGRSLPMLPDRFQADDLWIKALSLSYASELRTEKPGYAEKVMNRDKAYYHKVLAAAVEDGRLPLRIEGDTYVATISAWRRWQCRLAWMLRRAQGKLLSLLRLLKALYTFEGGLDYIAWKLERHSGQKISIPDKVRRRPLLHIWGLFWQLRRRGVFR
ncbi:MAG: phosphatidate cytidylyltransferase [gamma proteobacterium symbiont of Bathyaustriella thionipta]|nr:phosphatidate cytidylyltransferase [gamma proteobacterium symbiont of Bathyaustriella thionipta]